jgi:hypothetical protein
MEPELSSPLKTDRRLWWLPSVDVFLFLIVFILSLYMMPRLMNGDGDLGRHITIGNAILDQGKILNTDIFSHTMAGEPLILHEWLSDVIFALVHRAAGLNGVAWLTAIILASTYLLLTTGLKFLQVRTAMRLVLGVLAMMVGSIHWLTRPHIFTTLIFTYFTFALIHSLRHKELKVLLPLPLVMILWANLHGAFISGFVLVVLFAIGALLDKDFSAVRTFSILLFSLLIASLINPYGLVMLTHSASYLQSDYLVDNTIEYQSPNFHEFPVILFGGLILLSLVIIAKSEKSWPWKTLVPLSFWLLSALYSARNIPLFGQIAVMLLAGQADELTGQVSEYIDQLLTRTDQIGRRAWGWMWGALIIGLLLLMQASGFPLDPELAGNNFDPGYFPIEAINTLKETGLPEGNVFNEFAWGGYLLYQLWPEQQVFIDGQTDFYGEDVTRTHSDLINATDDWQTTFDSYNIQWVILPPQRTLNLLLAQSDDWQLIYEDETAYVWVKTP